MSVGAMTRVMDQSEASGMERLVLLVMANRAGGDHDECFASVDRLAYDARVDPRTVQRAVQRLASKGDLVFSGVHPRYRTNVFQVMPRQGVADSHPPGAGSSPVPPELKELGVKGSSSGSLSSHPTFAAFYEAYPRHVARRTAERAYAKAVKRASPEIIIAAAQRFAADPNLPEKVFIPHPSTWLNADCWEDEPLPARHTSSGSFTDRLLAREGLQRGG